MKVLNLALSGALVAMMGVAACNENPIVDPGTGPGIVTNLKASSRSETSVALQWGAPASAATSYGVSWAGTTDASAAKGSVDTILAGNTSQVITGLTAGVEYTFTVTARNASGSSSTTMKWAGATRYSNDAGTPAVTIRVYEKASTLGSAITLDPLLGGPRNVSVIKGTPGKAQLALFVYADSLIVGPLYAITEYKSSANFDLTKVDSSTYISQTTYAVADLSSWFVDKSIDQLISPTGNVRAYNISPTESQAQGFFVRTGTGQAASPYHYARVLVKSNGGKLLQGSAGNRYVELEISYQNTPNLPYAKRAAGFTSPIGYTATLNH